MMKDVVVVREIEVLVMLLITVVVLRLLMRMSDVMKA
jgi:hypothetical protein